MSETQFKEFPKMPRWSREVIITEKIDGTNASIYIGENGEFRAGSRTRWITPEDDNFGFAGWAYFHKDELMKLGIGHHFGEWWGKGIQRGYGLLERRFSLFNVSRWGNGSLRPECCDIVPIIDQGMMRPRIMEDALELLRGYGSFAAPGFMNPEGVVMFHVQGNIGFKKTLEKDEVPKSLHAKAKG
jgi:hypothetical protein